MDYMVSGVIENQDVRVYAINGTEMAGESQRIHTTSPVVTAAVGRVMNAVAMMSMMLKNEKDKISAQIKCDGPIENIMVIANSNGELKADVFNPQVDILLNEKGKLDVSKAIGRGTLTIIKDIGLKNPYVGTVEIVSGEIAEDFTYYFVTSEQTPSVVALGVLVNPDGTVKKSGGFIIQLMPNYTDEIVSYIEGKMATLSSITQLMEKGLSPEDILKMIFEGYNIKITEKKQIKYHCDCSRERFQKGIISLGKEEISTLIHCDEEAEIICHFCNEKYYFNKQDLEELINKI